MPTERAAAHDADLVEGEQALSVLPLDLHNHAVFHRALAGKEAFKILLEVVRLHFGKEADAPQIHTEHGYVVGDGDIQRR